jgi:maltose-binding protein MalE
MRDYNIKLNSFYALIGVVIVAFTAGTALLVLYNNTSPPSFDYRVFAQEEDNQTTTTADNTTSSTNLSSNTTLIDFVSNIEQIKAHLDAAMMNKQAGNNSLAQAHTLHPIAEIYSSIEPQIANANMTLNQTLASNLNELSQIVNSSTTDEFNTQAQKINGLVNQTVKQVVPVETANSSTFSLAVVADLLSIASAEYGEAVENGMIKEIVEYQDGQAFVSRAQDLMVQMSSTGLPQEQTPEIEETNKLFSDLNTAIQNKSSPELVDTSIRAIIHQISK